MIVYRLARLPYVRDLSGYGASLSPVSRWNSMGVSMLYTAQNRALAFAEVFVHLKLRDLPQDMMMVTLLLPDNQRVNEAVLDKDIREYDLKTTQRLGDEFVMNPFLFGLRVPSYVVPGEHNILINPRHKDLEKILIEDVQPFTFDHRLKRS